MSQTLTVAADEDMAWNLALTGPDGLPAVFDLASTFEANVFQGPNSVVIFHPAAAWADGTGSIIRLSVASADTEDLPPRNYNMQVWVIPAGTTQRINAFDGYLSVTPSANVTPDPATVASPTSVTQGHAPTRLGAVYCTDEDIAVEAPFDYVNICPKDQVKAFGLDGYFLVGSPWVLTSKSVDFELRGVAANDVIYLTKPTQVFSKSNIGTLLAVESVTGRAVEVRRVGGYRGEGSPPVTGAQAGVEFTVLTFRPQIERVCYQIRKRFGIDDQIPDHANALLYDALELREAAVLSVVARAYAMKGEKSDFAHKMAVANMDLERAMGQLQVHWGNLGLGRAPTGIAFSPIRR